MSNLARRRYLGDSQRVHWDPHVRFRQASLPDVTRGYIAQTTYKWNALVSHWRPVKTSVLWQKSIA
jgi:hypothetical protein